MNKKLENELIALANDILRMKSQEDINTLYRASQMLYEKLTVLKYTSESHENETELQTQKEDVGKRFEKLANSVLDNNRYVPESNPHENEEEIMTPGMETIKSMVEEMPKKESLEDILSEVMPDPVFVKRDADLLSPKEQDIEVMNEKRQATLNNKLIGSIKVGLNDRLAFVKHLFDGNTDDFNRVISQLNSFQNEEEAKEFVTAIVKPDHKNWEGKEEYEARLLELIAARFN